MISRFLLLLLLASSCSNDLSDIEKLSLASIFHDNSSKIWVINKVKMKGVNYSAYQLKEKDVAIFYDDNSVLIQPMKTLGKFPNRTGELVLSNNNKTCEFKFHGENWIFETKELTSKRIVLKHKSTSTFKYDLELISYPKSNPKI